MEKEKVKLDSIALIGVTTRTNNKNEMIPGKSKIGALAGNYWSSKLADEFKARSDPYVTYAVYTEYESDEHGDYTYFIGEKVKSLDSQNHSKFKPLIVPKGTYQKFTTKSGKMPDIVIASWQEIWKMTQDDFGGKRNYIADFEVYDKRSSDPNNMVIDIYIGIEEK